MYFTTSARISYILSQPFVNYLNQSFNCLLNYCLDVLSANLSPRLLDVLGENLCRRSRSQFLKRISKSLGKQFHMPSFQILGKVLARVGFFALCNSLGCALKHDFAALVTTLGAEVDDVVNHLDDIEIVLNDYDCVACIY